MGESSIEYRQARTEQGADCVDSQDLTRYLTRIGMDTHSLRNGLMEAVIHVYGGTAAPTGMEQELPYPADRVERALFEDAMQSTQQILVADPNLAAALRHAMRLLEDAAEAAALVRVLLERPDEEKAMQRLTLDAPGTEDC
ncbi:hypothetical protein ACIRU8_45375 [Streptomyces sp. NPDC101175]|uniref:hypothetical protein n=1 Tax=Streptomyces sp. NPDC101175 TaxID=3366123 RepID=UPI003836879F